jgi:hypothetical protein
MNIKYLNLNIYYNRLTATNRIYGKKILIEALDEALCSKIYIYEQKKIIILLYIVLFVKVLELANLKDMQTLEIT